MPAQAHLDPTELASASGDRGSGAPARAEGGYAPFDRGGVGPMPNGALPD